jgi:hypothetical protein
MWAIRVREVIHFRPAVVGLRETVSLFSFSYGHNSRGDGFSSGDDLSRKEKILGREMAHMPIAFPP